MKTPFSLPRVFWGRPAQRAGRTLSYQKETFMFEQPKPYVIKSKTTKRTLWEFRTEVCARAFYDNLNKDEVYLCKITETILI